MHKPLYHYLYIKSPIAKIAIGILALVVTLAVLGGIIVTEVPRMEAQTANWNGRSIEKGAALFASNCAPCHGDHGQGTMNVAPALNSKYWFTHRLDDLGYTGSQKSYVLLTVAAGRPSKVNSQWAQRMATWSRNYGGPLRDDQIDALANYILNWQESAVEQTDEEDPWQPFEGVDTGWAGVRAAEAGITETVGISDTQTVSETAEPRAPEVLFVNMGCSGCHNLNEPQDENTPHLVGPNLGNLAEVAGTKVPGEDAETYVHTSIVAPNDFVNPGYLPNLMPQNFAEQMTPEEINALVTWLLDPNRAQ